MEEEEDTFLYGGKLVAFHSVAVSSVRACVGKSYEEEDTCMSYEEVETFRCCVICACLRLCVQGKPSTNKEHLLLIRNTYYQ